MCSFSVRLFLGFFFAPVKVAFISATTHHISNMTFTNPAGKNVFLPVEETVVISSND